MVPPTWGAVMKRSRFTDRKIVRILQEVDKSPVVEVAKRHGVSQPSSMSGARSLASLATNVYQWISFTAVLMLRWLLKLGMSTTMQFNRIPAWITKGSWSSWWNGVMNQPTEPEFLDDVGLKNPDRSTITVFVVMSPLATGHPRPISKGLLKLKSLFVTCQLDREVYKIT